MAKKSAITFGVIFVIAGLWGFTGSFLGIFAADAVGSIIHIIVGIVLLYVAFKAVASTISTLKTVGILYIIFAILGFWQGTTILFGAFATNGAANWLYLILGVVIAAIGFADKKSVVAPQM